MTEMEKYGLQQNFSGINIIDKNTRKISYLANTYNNPFSLNDNATCSLYLDDCNTMWVGLYNKGVNYYNPVFKKFSTRYLKESHENINTIGEGADGNLWFGTEGGGIVRYDRSNNTETKFYL